MSVLTGFNLVGIFRKSCLFPCRAICPTNRLRKVPHQLHNAPTKFFFFIPINVPIDRSRRELSNEGHIIRETSFRTGGRGTRREIF